MLLTKRIQKTFSLATTANVKLLRQTTGAPLLKCKEVLQEASNFDAACKLLKAQNIALGSAVNTRKAQEGLWGVIRGPKEICAALMRSETDFVSRSSEFCLGLRELLQILTSQISFQGSETSDTSSVNDIWDHSGNIADHVALLSAKFQEKVALGNVLRFKAESDSVLGLYVHNEIEPLMGSGFSCVVLRGAQSSLQQLADDLAVHVYCHSPRFVSRTEVSSETLNSLRTEFYEAMDPAVRNKNEELVTQIIEGKLLKSLADTCLLDQPAQFIPGEKTVGEVLREAREAFFPELRVESFHIKRLK